MSGTFRKVIIVDVTLDYNLANSKHNTHEGLSVELLPSTTPVMAHCVVEGHSSRRGAQSTGKSARANFPTFCTRRRHNGIVLISNGMFGLCELVSFN